MSAAVYADVDARLLQLAEQLDQPLADRIRRLVDADAVAHDVIDLRGRCQRAEDVAAECQRQLRSSHRQVDELRIRLAQAEGGVGARP